MKPIDRITKAKISLLLSQPWFGQLACYINPIEDEKIETLGINAKGELYFNPKFIKSCDDKEIAALLCHEILHLALQHPFRLQNRDQRLFNVAADLKVNEIIASIPMKLPTTDLIPSGGCWIFKDIKIKDIDKKSAEQIYQELLKYKSKLKKLEADLDLKSSGQKELSETELRELAKEWRNRANAAMSSAKGNIPKGLERVLKELEYPTLPWLQIIKQRFKSVSRERNWKKINKKYQPWYFPGTARNKALTAVIAIDTSASMSQDELTKVLSEIWGLAETFRHIKFYLITCDADIHDEIKLTNGNKRLLKNIKMHGSGGTDFRPVFEKIKKDYLNEIDCLIYFTDGYGNFPSKAPGYPDYWILTEEGQNVPFGRKIYLKVN